MQIEKGYIYHIYNQGNNKQKIFFKRENYLFFVSKIKTHILPYGDILAWCLMPNHFHLMVLVKEIKVPVQKNSDTMTRSHRITYRTFNDSIGIMLRTYTRAINKQKNKSGSLFKAHSKAECVNCLNRITPSFITEDSITKIIIQNPEKQYPQICFDYIHQNPVKAGLVNNMVDWKFSSAIDYANIRNGKLVNKEVARMYVKY